MAKNVFLKEKAVADIDAQIAQVLQRLGNPKPPLSLNVVRAALDLDFGYYSASDAGLLQETVAKLRVGTKQVLLRPSLLIDVVRKMDLRALYIPDQKRILLDKDQPDLKHRWNEAHEIGHSVIPWHAGAMLGDDDHTLIPSCHASLEAEANFAAARLLFLQDRFRDEALALPPSFKNLEALAARFGNTKASTFWRCIEYWGAETPMVGLITGHPHPAKRRNDFDPAAPCKHFVQSQPFSRQFANLQETLVFDQVVKYCGSQRGGSLGGGDILLTDDNGDAHVFEFETFCYHHHTLTIGLYRHPRYVAVAA